MLSVVACIVVQHDLRLVVVAALVCAIACGAAFGFHRKSLTAAGRAQWAWMALTGLVAGSGVWATHFVAMLAYMPGVPLGFEPVLTVASWATAVIGMGVGFAVPVLQPGRAAAVAGGGLAGMAVSAMHFMGIGAMRAQAQMTWDERYVAAALVICAAAGAGAFYARMRLRGRLGWVVPTVLLVLGIVLLHFTAMTALTLTPDPTQPVPHEAVGRGVLVVATVALAALLVTAGACLAWMERVGRRATLRGLRDALDVVPSALSFYDTANRMVSWNRAYAELLREIGVEAKEGLTRMEMVEAALRAGWRPVDGGDYLDRRRDASNGASPPLALRTPDGRWIRHESFATADGGGVTVMTNVTEQEEAARALADARDAAEAANRAKSQFLANMSHEIRTPLNGVLGVADVLAGTKLDGNQQELVSVIRTSGALLNSLLTDLLDLARVEAGVTELKHEPVSLAELAGAVRSLYAPHAEQKGLELVLEVDPQAGRVACDGRRLRQVLGNLVSNAVKFTERGQVAIRVARIGERVTFAVRDTGAGFDSTLKDALFGRFQQADESSTRRHGGAGLGLAICREYVSLMGGELDCSSAPGQGSTFAFTLDLPRLPEPALAEGLAAAASIGVEPGRFRVLVVDDNEINRQVLGLILDAAEIEHAEAENGRAGVEAATTGGFDAVLMDIQMPVMDGFEATRRIRAWEQDCGRGRMPIFIVSANGLQEHVDAGVAAGADGHLNKPVSVPELLGMLEPHAMAAREAA